jgi:hypothetical protein
VASVEHNYLVLNYYNEQFVLDGNNMMNKDQYKNHELDMMVHNNMMVVNNMNPYILIKINTNELKK